MKYMKAVVYEKYGPPEVLQVRDIKKPSPKDNEILIRICVTSVNAADWRLRKADPFLIRLFFGLFRPRKKILGVALSGVVEEAGKDVTRFKPGDPVFGSTGFGLGAHAEYKCMSENARIVLKPANISHEEAAAIPFGGVTALHYLRKANIRSGQHVLVYGASGCTGSHAVQLAKYFGAAVTGVCSGSNAAMVRSLGADEVIDYKKENFAKSGKRYDIIFDAVGKTSFAACREALAEKGKYVTVSKGVAKDSIGSLVMLKELAEKGKIKPFIDRVYTLQQMAEAHRYAELGHKRGSVVITIAQ